VALLYIKKSTLIKKKEGDYMMILNRSSLRKKESARGLLSKYADVELAKKEKEAWECAAVEKYGNIKRKRK
jgi:hypothetical protein